MEQLEREWLRLRRLTDVVGGQEEKEEDDDREKDGRRFRSIVVGVKVKETGEASKEIP